MGLVHGVNTRPLICSICAKRAFWSSIDNFWKILSEDTCAINLAPSLKMLPLLFRQMHSIRQSDTGGSFANIFFGPFQPQDQSNTLNHIFAMISKSNIYYRWYTENWSCMRAHARGERHKNRWLDCVIMMRAHLTELRPEPSF